MPMNLPSYDYLQGSTNVKLVCFYETESSALIAQVGLELTM